MKSPETIKYHTNLSFRRLSYFGITLLLLILSTRAQGQVSLKDSKSIYQWNLDSLYEETRKTTRVYNDLKIVGWRILEVSEDSLTLQIKNINGLKILKKA